MRLFEMNLFGIAQLLPWLEEYVKPLSGAK